jgi:ElaB/YqjD/DUF883 family membrane-anchored ribosome-binding protein
MKRITSVAMALMALFGWVVSGCDKKTSDDLKQKAEETKQTLETKAKEAKEAADEQIEKAKPKLKEFGEKAKDAAQDAMEKTKEAVHSAAEKVEEATDTSPSARDSDSGAIRTVSVLSRASQSSALHSRFAAVGNTTPWSHQQSPPKASKISSRYPCKDKEPN